MKEENLDNDTIFLVHDYEQSCSDNEFDSVPLIFFHIHINLVRSADSLDDIAFLSSQRSTTLSSCLFSNRALSIRHQTHLQVSFLLMHK